jgi:hypothetical protein
MSAPGNGAVLLAVPDIPTNLVENLTHRTAYSLGITWTPGSSNGSPIIDYRIVMAIETGSYQVLATSTTNSFVVISLEPGTTYSFKVQARNSYGSSGYSNPLTLKCASVPDAPYEPDGYILNDQVYFSWSDPADNGSPITAYKIYFR